MDKLDRYVARVCGSIGGPRAMRQHVQQELREHLLDAVAQHEASGMPREQAVDRALEEFGNQEEVRSELVAAHGHRVMAVVIEKALQWKERTMRAKWLWTTWAHLALLVVIALQALFILGTLIFIVPKYQELMAQRLIDIEELRDGATWIKSCFLGVLRVANFFFHNWGWLLLPIVLWITFEWRVRSENKSYMRLGGLGTVSIALTVVIWLLAGSLLLLTGIGVPGAGPATRGIAIDQVSQLNAAVSALDDAVAKEDWQRMLEHATAAQNSMARLHRSIPELATPKEPGSPDQLRAIATASRDLLNKLTLAIHYKDLETVQSCLRDFPEVFQPVREAAANSLRQWSKSVEGGAADH